MFRIESEIINSTSFCAVYLADVELVLLDFDERLASVLVDG